MRTISEVREKLTGRINQTNRLDLLEEMLQLFEKEEVNSFYELTDEQQIAVANALEQYEKGEYSDGDTTEKEKNK